MTNWNILQTFGIVYDHLVQFVFIWYSFPVLVCLDQEKSGRSASTTQFLRAYFKLLEILNESLVSGTTWIRSRVS
jgi:hypothetical protein